MWNRKIIWDHLATFMECHVIPLLQLSLLLPGTCTERQTCKSLMQVTASRHYLQYALMSHYDVYSFQNNGTQAAYSNMQILLISITNNKGKISHKSSILQNNNRWCGRFAHEHSRCRRSCRNVSLSNNGSGVILSRGGFDNRSVKDLRSRPQKSVLTERWLSTKNNQ